MITPCPTAAVTGYRTVVEAIVSVAICLAMLRTWFVAGVVPPVAIRSGSMAPRLLPESLWLVCGDCHEGFAVEVGAAAGGCPQCGRRQRTTPSDAPLAADGVLIDRVRLCLAGPRRWQAVVFRDPDTAGWVLKRVVGLPGERIELVAGDVVADGRLARKSLDEQRALAIPVHDASRADPPDTPARWQPAAGSRWRAASGQLAHPGASEGIEWIEYRHWQRVVDGGQQRVVPAAVTDDLWYNAALAIRRDEVATVTDLILECTLRDIAGNGRLWIEIRDGRRTFRVGSEPVAGRWTAAVGGGVVATATTNPFAAAGLYVALVDRQLLVALDDRVVLRHPFDAPPGPGSERPLAIGVEGLQVTIGEVRLLRDVFYRPAPVGARAPRRGAAALGADEYFVLGDNAAVSDDSRVWRRPGLHRTALVGVPLLAIGRGRAGGFQLPDPRRVRYIH